MTRRRASRRLALDLLYQADVGGRPAPEVLEERRGMGDRLPGFTEDLVRGVAEHAEKLDALIGRHAEDWSVSRMLPVDRALLRIACFEILHRDDVPAAVAIDEAVEAAKELSTDDSGRFINGILGKIARDHAGAG